MSPPVRFGTLAAHPVEALRPIHLKGTPMTELERLVEQWHTGTDDRLLTDYLGVSRDDYAAWVEGRMSDRELLATRATSGEGGS